MTRHELFKFLHVVGAITWVGSGIGLVFLHQRLRAANDYATLLGFRRQEKALGNLLFAPAFVLTLGFGVLMVATEPWVGFGDLWILIGFGGIIVSSAIEMGVVQRAGKRFEEAASHNDPDAARMADAARTVGMGSLASVLVLLFVVWAMVAKPGL